MPNTPHHKVSFSKRDIVALHELPSAQSEDPIIVNAHRGGRGNGWVKAHVKAVVFCAIVLVCLIAALVIVLDRGLVDGVIENRARVAMSQALGDAYTSEIGGAGVRVTPSGQFTLIARDVSIKTSGEAGGAYAVNRLRLVLDPLALLTGRIKVNSIGVDGARLIAGVGPGFG
ncbi:MAG: hypothetical protein CML30_08815, partial [Rhizobiales bacterium]|nr:hypothetical protein [Hyphomicrobiales bacterium]